MLIRPANVDDRAAIWSIIGPVIRAGETYSLDRDLNEDQALDYWMGSDKETFVADDGSAIPCAETISAVSPINLSSRAI